MKCELALILCISFLMIVPLGVMRSVGDISLSNRHKSAMFAVDLGKACLAEGDVLSSLQKMSSAGSQLEADQARDLLLDNARKSPRCRRELIAAIMSAMDTPNLDFEQDPSSYYLWRDGAQLLGDLKAAEALDLLISHLDLNNGSFSTTMSQQPALGAVIKMGPIAIPKLDAVLRNSPDHNMRRYAVYCISSIGGRSAMQVLNQALPSEPDPCISRFIRVSIDSFDKQHYRLKDDNVKWFMAFMCNE